MAAWNLCAAKNQWTADTGVRQGFECMKAPPVLKQCKRTAGEACGPSGGVLGPLRGVIQQGAATLPRLQQHSCCCRRSHAVHVPAAAVLLHVTQRTRHPQSIVVFSQGLAELASPVDMRLSSAIRAAKVGRLVGSCAMQARIRRASCGGVPSGGCSALFSMATTWMTCTEKGGFQDAR